MAPPSKLPLGDENSLMRATRTSRSLSIPARRRYYPRMPASTVSRRRRPRRLDDLSDDELLDIRFCDLPVRLRDGPLSDDLAHLHAQLDRRGIAFRPHAWLSTEWFSPDGIPGIAIPFYLAHPRLRRLEQRMTGEAEGGDRNRRQRILRHEAGHALDTAFGLRRMASWRRVFGPASKRYPQDYSVRPGSRRFVLHLSQWYAQSHPTEDFAETFAVWLTPKAKWRREYAGWPALAKLEFVDALMTALAGRRPRNRDRSEAAPLAGNRRTLRAHYRNRHLTIGRAERRYDRWLEGVFLSATLRPDAASAATTMRAMAPALRRRLLKRGTAGPYLVDHSIESVVRRLRQLDLRAFGPRRQLENDALDLLEAIINDILRRNRERYVL